ncbi:MAG: glycosyltransferase family 2 protein [Candidatus Eremiobacteraeota bacterium]|nr:glycosyltransferase family 2 protein [Candidatus Eremiobacteraeota bacterium]
MKLFMTLLVRDNADIVAANLAYHLGRGVDHAIVTDNGSTDATLSIVESFVGSGRVTLIHEPHDDYNQAVWVTRMARAAAALGADWVLNCDADELWWPMHGDLKSVLARVPAECGSVIAERTNMLPLRVLAGHPFEAMVCRDVRSVNGLGRPLPGKAAHRAVLDIEVQPGNHAVSSPSLGASVRATEMLIYHFPHRSYEQMEHKIALGGPAVARNASVPESVFDVWRALYDLLRAGRLREWYDALPHGDGPDIDRRIASGEVVRDERLAAYLRENVFALPDYGR